MRTMFSNDHALTSLISVKRNDHYVMGLVRILNVSYIAKVNS